MPIFSQDEVVVLLLAGLAALLSWGNFSRQMIAIRPYRYRPSSRFPLYGAVVLSGVALFFVLTQWSSHDVRDSGPYIFFYFVLGVGWLGIGRLFLNYLNLCLREDVLERNNGATAWAGGASFDPRHFS